MSASKIGLGVAAGYLLGRTKKLKFAITVGSMLAGQRISTNPQILLKQLGELAEKNPEIAKLQKRITGELVEAAKTAAIAAASSRVDAANKSLTSGRAQDDEDEGDDEGSDEEADEAADDQAEDEYEDEADDDEAEDEADDERPRTRLTSEAEDEYEEEGEPEEDEGEPEEDEGEGVTSLRPSRGRGRGRGRG